MNLTDDQKRAIESATLQNARQIGEKIEAIRADFDTFCQRHNLHCCLLAVGFTPLELPTLGEAKPLAVLARVNAQTTREVEMMTQALTFEMKQLGEEEDQTMNSPTYFGPSGMA